MPDSSGHPQAPMTASQRLAAALGRPRPEPLSGERLRDFERRQDEVDAEIERRYGPRRSA
ncbi:hypothetical protein ACTMTJ_21445 [Phytohabitans sp. LJ34]|uniref:hypothetical protein n=1 Tax=Phytohabitans sp. LJ34 TaxID=3452217 RepID=UPI003F8C2D7E